MLAISLPATALLQDVEAASSIEAKRNKVVQTALSLQNKVEYVNWRQRQEIRAPYKTDCSGFTYLAYRLANVGLKLVNKDDDGQAKVGQKVFGGNFKIGDLIFFWLDSSDKKNVGHVGIYIGDGKMIHNITAKRAKKDHHTRMAGLGVIFFLDYFRNIGEGAKAPFTPAYCRH
ncbi:NlpC/P60 family protein [Paenibacillus sp. LHD-38]|uniref:C40 family peptidase n=1 Tax=Paenibacillus sp. LHD-38 TaxID=3072143 RepID=UPI00280F5C8C|nr:NlpC/P60 family protein [Paenibacillus sp. LHD-38]MDQ8734868.1 NlpC/P60 family protein [Paenibacillus sp. LHD-38]